MIPEKLSGGVYGDCKVDQVVPLLIEIIFLNGVVESDMVVAILHDGWTQVRPIVLKLGFTTSVGA